ncbi:MAG: hypothetical protein ACQGVK_11905 [Myxococcota bacterium]
MGEFRIASTLAAPPRAVWDHAMSPSGVNRELRPLLRMSFPDDVENIVACWRPGERVFRSWLLLGGFLPVDYDDLAIVEVEPGRRFLERSSLLSQRVWEHERIVEPLGEGCRLTDRIRFEPRLGVLGAVYAPIFRVLFRHRHRNLRRLFG